MRISLPNGFGLFVSYLMFLNIVSGIAPTEDYCINIDNPDAEEHLSMMCLTAPILSCPPTYFGCPNDNLTPTNTGMATAMAGEAACPNPVVSFSDVFSTNTPCMKVIHRTWSATYPAGSASIKLHSTCQQTLFLEDTQDPVINNCPTDLTVNLAGNCAGIAAWNVPTASDDCGIQSFTTTHFSGTSFPLGVTNVTYTAKDFCGNEVQCSFNVTVIGSCCQAPTIFCPSNLSLCPGSNTNTSATGVPSAIPTDPSCGSPIVNFSDSTLTIAGCNGNNAIIQRTWTATDPSNSGLSNSCVQTISTTDNQSPVISNIPSDMVIDVTGGQNCSTPVTWNVPIASDACGIASFTSTHNSGQSFSQGSTLVTYTALDNCGNMTTGAFQVTVQCIQCNSNPIITCPSNYVGCPSSTAPLPSISGSATAVAGSNLCGTPIISFNDIVLASGSCNSRTIQRTWSASDPISGSYSSTCVQLLTLDDTQSPVIGNVPNDITLTGNGTGCSVIANWATPTFTDNCGIQNVSSNFQSGHAFTQGTTTVSYTVSDNCGNVSNASFTVTVNCASLCNVPPSISCPSNYTSCPIFGSPSTNISGIATAGSGSIHCPVPVVTFSDDIVLTRACANSKLIVRTFTATNPNNQSLQNSCTQLIDLVDDENPRFINCPNNVVVSASGTNCSSVASWGTVLATDNCVTPSLRAVDQNGRIVYSGSSFTKGINKVSYTATDGCGNTASCVFNVTVNCIPVCDVAPVITCPAPVTSLCIGSDISIASLGNATATRGANCSSTVVTHSDLILSQTSCSRTIRRTFTASYLSGSNLSSSCTQSISLSDNEAPIINNCPSDIVVSSPTTPVTWISPVASDLCSTPTLTSNYQSGSVFPIGITQVIYLAKDGCGNQSSCSFNVIVNVNSSISCPDDITVSCGIDGGAYVDWAVPTVTGTCSSCNNDEYIAGFFYMGTFNGNQYFCSLAPATWSEASRIAQSNGGYLACIGSAEENEFLTYQLATQSAWIGLYDSNTEGTFEWTCGEQLSYTNWYPGQPNNFNGSQDYVEILSNGQWNDQYGNYQLEFILERPCTTIEQVAGPAPGSFLTGGTYVVSYKVNDSCGSIDQCSFTITVESSLTISCPRNISTSALENNSGTVVTWDNPDVNSCCSVCPNGGGQDIPGFVYMGSFNGHHYYCSRTRATWPKARAICEDNGGYLAVINGASENAYLAELLTLQSAWIGCYDSREEGVFEWVNGDALTYTNWYPGQPNNFNGSQDYVELLNNGEWNDQYNSFELEYILELPGCIDVTQIAGPSSGSLLAPGSNHTVTYEATDGCGNRETCSFNINVASIPVGNGFCSSYGRNSDNFFIQSILFGPINNYSGNNGGYKDFSNLGCGIIAPNTAYPLQMSPGYSGVAASKVFWEVYIDYNLDGDFEDASEFVAYGCGSTTLSGTITTPYSLWNGTTIMRVAMKKGSYPSSACDIFPYGEVEDYCIKIINAADLTETDVIEKRNDSHLDAVFIGGDITEERSTVEIYPNPVSEYLSINSSDSKDINSIRLYSIDGKVIHSLIDDKINDRNQIDVSQYNSGIYLLKVAYNDGEVTTQKITIHH